MASPRCTRRDVHHVIVPNVWVRVNFRLAYAGAHQQGGVGVSSITVTRTRSQGYLS